MKILTITCTALLVLFAVTGYAQSGRAARPTLFAAFPATIKCTEAQLSALFTAAKGQQINLALTHDLKLSGSVTSSQVKYNNLQTIVIQLPAFKNTLFSLSKQTGANNKITYVGRILNSGYTDGFVLKHDSADNYQFIKINTEKILVDCNR